MAIWSDFRKALTKKKSKTAIGDSGVEKGVQVKSSTDNSQQRQPIDLGSYASQCNNVVHSTAEVHTQLSAIQSLQHRALYSLTGDHTAGDIENANKQVTGKAQDTRGPTPDPKDPPVRTCQTSRCALRSCRTQSTRCNGPASRYRARVRQSLRTAFKRQYRVTRPDSSEEEVRAAYDENSESQQVFVQALMHREGRVPAARNVLDAVGERHEAIAKAETRLVELTELFHLLGENVLEQGVAMQDIEKDVEMTKKNIELATVDLSDATDSARKARKKKWTCFWISGKSLVLPRKFRSSLENENNLKTILVVIIVTILAAVAIVAGILA